jgi:uncharacterized protein YbjT (DUF2867 family)
LVTGASGGGGLQGATGRRLTRLLEESNVPVRALVHTLDDRANSLREIGAEVLSGDLLHIESVRKALTGIDSAYFCYPVGPGMLEAVAIFAQAAREEGVKFIVHLSIEPAADQSSSPWLRKVWLAERILAWSGIPTFWLRAAIFYENVFAQCAKGIREHSEVLAPFGLGDGIVPAIAAQDVARLAFAALQKPEAFAGQTLRVFGSLESLNDIAEDLTQFLGRPIQYREITVDELLKEPVLRDNLQTEDQRGHIKAIWPIIYRINQDPGLVSSISSSRGLFQQVTGVAPLSINEWLKENVALVATGARPVPLKP